MSEYMVSLDDSNEELYDFAKIVAARMIAESNCGIPIKEMIVEDNYSSIRIQINCCYV